MKVASFTSQLCAYYLFDDLSVMLIVGKKKQRGVYQVETVIPVAAPSGPGASDSSASPVSCVASNYTATHLSSMNDVFAYLCLFFFRLESVDCHGWRIHLSHC